MNTLILERRRFGLTVWQLYVNKIYVGEWMSLEYTQHQADAYERKLAQRKAS